MAVAPDAIAIAIAFARSQLGDPYLFGGTGPDRWDCSGLVMVSFAKGGVILPRTTGMMINVGTPVAESELRPGDLVFPDFHHVQIYTGNGMIIEAPQAGEVVVERKMWGFWRARRVVSGGPQDIKITIPNPVGAATDVFGPFATVFKWIVDSHNWLRMAEMVAGVLLIIVSLTSWSMTTSAVKGVLNYAGST